MNVIVTGGAGFIGSSLIKHLVKKNNHKIIIYNQGLSLRDFIHLDDIGKIYTIFLNKKFLFNLKLYQFNKK